jgi:hypothetical protein
MTAFEGREKQGRQRAGARRRIAPAAPEAEKPARGRDRSPEGFLPELLRRGLSLGFTGLFMTEEALRRALGDTLPREWLEFAVEQSDRMRAELLDRISREFGRVLSALDPVEVLRRFLDGQTLEVRASIRLADTRERGGEGRSVRVSAGRAQEEKS